MHRHQAQSFTFLMERQAWLEHSQALDCAVMKCNTCTLVLIDPSIQSIESLLTYGSLLTHIM